MPSINMLPRYKAIIFTVFIYLLCFVAVELACSLIVGNKYIAVDPIDERYSKSIPGYFMPLQNKTILFLGAKPYNVSINLLGFRNVGYADDKPLEYFRDHYRILCLGDSVTFGLFADGSESYPYLLQQRLLKRSDKIVVFNAGVGGATISDYLYYIKNKCSQIRPNLVIMNFCNNDFDELITAKKPMYERLIDKSHLPLWDRVKRLSCMRIFRKFELAYRYRRYLNKIKDQREREIILTQSKRLEDILYVDKNNSGLIGRDPDNPTLIPVWEKYFIDLDQVISLLNSMDIDLLFFIYPTISSVFNEGKDYHEILIGHLKEKGVPCIDLRAVFFLRKQEYLRLYLNPPLDYHLGHLGNEILVNHILNYINDIKPNN